MHKTIALSLIRGRRVFIAALACVLMVGVCADVQAQNKKKPAGTKTTQTGKKKPAAKKPAEKKPAPAKQMVVRRKEDNKWAVKKAGSDKATKLFNTKAEAEEYAKGIAKNQGTTVQKQKKDGKFQKNKY